MLFNATWAICLDINASWRHDENKLHLDWDDNVSFVFRQTQLVICRPTYFQRSSIYQIYRIWFYQTGAQTHDLPHSSRTFVSMLNRVNKTITTNTVQHRKGNRSFDYHSNSTRDTRKENTILNTKSRYFYNCFSGSAFSKWFQQLM